jgi:hypothetical protein
MAEMNEQGGMPGESDGTPQNEGLTFEQWAAGQDDGVKALLDGHVKGLKSALETERGQRQELAKQIKELSKGMEEGSQAREALAAMSGKLETFEQQLAAYDALSAAGVSNLRLAYLAAREAGAVRQDGTVDLDGLKSQFPELFAVKKPTPPGNAGAGAGTANGGQTGMNAFIRAAAGRK